MLSSKRHPIYEIYENLSKDLREFFSDSCRIYTEYPKSKEELASPSIVIECTRIDQAIDPANGEKGLKTYWEIRAYMPAFDEKNQLTDIDTRVLVSEIVERLSSDRFFSNYGYQMIFDGATDDNLDGRPANLNIWTADFTCNIWSGRDRYPSEKLSQEKYERLFGP